MFTVTLGGEAYKLDELNLGQLQRIMPKARTLAGADPDAAFITMLDILQIAVEDRHPDADLSKLPARAIRDVPVAVNTIFRESGLEFTKEAAPGEPKARAKSTSSRSVKG